MTAYRTLAIPALRAYLAEHPTLAGRIGPDPASWQIAEVSDGNLNSVHLVSGSVGGVCVKQSLPHVRVDPSWKMPLDRALYEARYMRETAPFVGDMMPALLHDDPALYLLVVESLAGHAVLRTALATGDAAPGFSGTIGRFVARSCFLGSTLAAPFENMARRLEKFSGNTALTRITVDLVLTDPFGGSSRNRIDHPELEPLVGTLQSDPRLRAAAGALQERFLCAPQGLLHGDLHTGSIMLRAGADRPDVRVIDGEFAHCGPIGFDCGLYLGNLALHAIANPAASAMMQAEAALFLKTFETEFRRLWQDHVGQGDMHSLLTPGTLPDVMDRYLAGVRRDTAGFMGAEIIRRTIGFAHVSDYDLCPTTEARIAAMTRALRVGRALMLEAGTIKTDADFWHRVDAST
ncbi:S-methyl-5-thioribose kinase [Tanticharoenia sakaeratensis]|jgi:5-methylthioribose kinase|uniref:S-methyl-5-thioribose kinase n=1 Tax=Tanticharoenia sakaeratensis NBRC 103193 TaxID=1231623 RepID=A0A0D6MLF2_9PROT|nr:S-methyl-5-thioribose kinase [Tanticharoenia sakaeratensis]GAN54235.1 methylthioribose kinase [Tanticharoenia sakaeratensis NBRC 103193]GBQ19204.1 methylthioribose kinase [Tanticharoenia sakaeratensis NBRC 103193]